MMGHFSGAKKVRQEAGYRLPRPAVSAFERVKATAHRYRIAWMSIQQAYPPMDLPKLTANRSAGWCGKEDTVRGGRRSGLEA